MTGKEYVGKAMRTYDGRATFRLSQAIGMEFPWDIDIGGVVEGCFGLSGESGELCDLVKKWVFHEKPLDEEHMKKELGDILWYVAMVCHCMNWDLDEVLQMNIDKLKARYPDGFDVNKANNRAIGDI